MRRMCKALDGVAPQLALAGNLRPHCPLPPHPETAGVLGDQSVANIIPNASVRRCRGPRQPLGPGTLKNRSRVRARLESESCKQKTSILILMQHRTQTPDESSSETKLCPLTRPTEPNQAIRIELTLVATPENGMARSLVNHSAKIATFSQSLKGP
jgi:hypothetical protein